MRPLQLSASSRAKMYRCYRLRLHSDMLFRGTEPLSRPESSQPVREARGIGSATLQDQYNSVRVRSSPCLRASVVGFSPICVSSCGNLPRPAVNCPNCPLGPSRTAAIRHAPGKIILRHALRFSHRDTIGDIMAKVKTCNSLCSKPHTHILRRL
jgi:hypothetical protein